MVINPGSTSTKLALFEGEREVFSQKIDHSVEDLRPYTAIFDQYEYRLGLIRTFLEEHQIDPATLSAVVGRGGLVRPIPCGTYLVNDSMLEDLRQGVEGHHASNLGPALAKGIADAANVPAYIVDPITVDEMDDVARLTGLPEIKRESRLHTLNQKAVARKVASQLGKRYEELNFIVCHLGTGTSIAAHRQGRVIDMCDARGEGPMSCDRSGAINSYLMMELIYSSKLTYDEMVRKLYMQSGLVAYLGTKDVREVERRIQSGDQQAKLVLDAMIYQNAKEIGAQAAALSGQVDRIIFTGGMVYDKYIVDELTRRVSFIAPIVVMPGEEEMEALALGAVRVLSGEETAKVYCPVKQSN